MTDEEKKAKDKGDKPGEDYRAAGAAAEKWPACPLALMFGLGPALRNRMADRLPEEFVEHAVGARREFLLAVRSLVDEALESQEEHLDRYRHRRAEREAKKPRKVAVE